LIVSYTIIFIKYLIFYLYFYLVGKNIIFLIKKYVREDNNKDVLYTRQQFLAPLLGIVFVGNLLIILNTFFPLKSGYVTLILLLLPVFSLRSLNFNLKKFYNVSFIFNYIVIPGILVVSTLDITFNYDAGYYHLLHQNWLRESNLIIGMVNIFFAFGMSSIYEYLSAFLWFDNTFVLLHFLNIYFVHFFYLFIKQHFIDKKYSELYGVSFVILLYSILDNFGYGGGRNGFIYIQGVSKQDTTVGILFWFLTLVILKKLVDKNISKFEIVTLSLIVFFVYQIKVSGVLIFILFLVLILQLMIGKVFKFSTILFLGLPTLVIALIWFTKSVLTTSCLIYPVDLTCFGDFDWYIPGSTAEVEYYTKLASKNYDLGTPFNEWIRKVAKDTFEYRGQVLKNFIISILAIFFISKLVLSKSKLNLQVLFISISYVLFNFVYLLFYGPIPRYAIGVCLVSVSLIGLFHNVQKINFSNTLKYGLIFLSVFLVVRLHSYESLLYGKELRLFNPENVEEVYEGTTFKKSIGDWVIPTEGDQCWAKLNCTMSKQDVKIVERGFFKTAYR